MYPKQYFDLFRSDIDEKIVFVGMSFDPAYATLWQDIIEPAILQAAFCPHRVDLQVAGDSIMIDIMKGILHAKLLLFDVTADDRGARNGNVMYELGLAHAIRHPEEVLIVRADSDPLLFDVANIRVHKYDAGDTTGSKNGLVEILTHLRSGITSLKTIVLEKTVGMLDEVCLGFLAGHANMDAFSLLEPKKAFEPETVAGRTAVRHLLDLGVVALVWNKDEYKYAYTWTFLGRALLAHLGFRTASKAGARPIPGTQLYHYEDGAENRGSEEPAVE